MPSAPPFGDGDVRREAVGRVEQVRRIALRNAGHRPRVDQLAQAGGEARTRSRDSGSNRRVQREDLILLGFLDEHACASP